MHYDAKLGHLEAEVHAIHKRLDSIADDLRSSRQAPKTHVYAVLIAIVTAMVTVGTFALTPVTQNVAEVKERLSHIERHDADGHPEAVKEKIDAEIKGVYKVMESLDAVHTRERMSNSGAILRFENRLDGLETGFAKLNTIAEERTERFKRALELRDDRLNDKAGDRWTGSEQAVFAKGIEQRLRALERQARAQ